MGFDIDSELTFIYGIAILIPKIKKNYQWYLLDLLILALTVYSQFAIQMRILILIVCLYKQVFLNLVSIIRKDA